MAQSMMLIEKSSHCMSWYDVITGEKQDSVSLPSFPHEFVVDSDLKYAYISHYGVQNSGIEGTNGRSVIVLDIRERRVVHLYDLGPHARPHGIGLDGLGRLYVLSEWTSHLLIKENPRTFDQGWDRLCATGGSKSHLFAVTLDGQKVFSMNLVSGDVTCFNPYDDVHTPIAIKTGEKPEGRCLRADESVLYTTNRLSNTVTVIDVLSLQVVRSFATPNDPCRIYHDHQRNRLMTMNHFGQSVSVFDESTGQAIHHKAMPSRPLAMCLDADLAFAYISIDCEQVHRISLDTFETVQIFETGQEPDMMFILPDGFLRSQDAARA